MYVISYWVWVVKNKMWKIIVLEYIKYVILKFEFYFYGSMGGSYWLFEIVFLYYFKVYFR